MRTRLLIASALFLQLILADRLLAGEVQSTLGGPLNDVLASMVTTVHDGDSQRASRSLENLGTAYSRFLDQFVAEPYCKGMGMENIAESCIAFRDKERSNIQNNSWSRPYRFGESEFASTTAIYNFVRRTRINEFYSCEVFLQLTVELALNEILNQEFWAVCR